MSQIWTIAKRSQSEQLLNAPNEESHTYRETERILNVPARKTTKCSQLGQLIIDKIDEVDVVDEVDEVDEVNDINDVNETNEIIGGFRGNGEEWECVPYVRYFSGRRALAPFSGQSSESLSPAPEHWLVFFGQSSSRVSFRRTYRVL